MRELLRRVCRVSMYEFVVLVVVIAVWRSLTISSCMLVTAWLRAETSRIMPGASLAQADRNAASPSMDESIGTEGRRSVGAGVVDPEGVSVAAPAMLSVPVVDSLVADR